jgi:putative phosphoribosyl transferase
VAEREQREIERRERAYRGERAAVEVQGKTVILADDGIATGATLRAALATLHTQKPARIIVAVGVAPPETCETLENEVDELVCLLTPDPFWAVGVWFAEFPPTTDAEVRTLLAEADTFRRQVEVAPTTRATPENLYKTTSVQIQAGQVLLDGDLTVPQGAKGIVLFAHGSGSSRFSPRNRRVAQVLQEGGLATLLFDLLTPSEEEIDMRTRQFRFDIELLAKRLVTTTDWLLHQPEVQHLKVGYFGASTGAAAALIAAAQRSGVVAAVVSRGGRPDLAMPVLSQVKAPTLLIVGGNDQPVIHMNEEALAQLHIDAKLEIVPGASHLFEESGTLDIVARLACDWFRRHLTSD